MKTPDVMHPTVHLNGTSPESLFEQAQKAHAALQAAFDALCDMQPNGRDYYPQGEDAIGRARKEHGERMAKVSAVLLEVQEIAITLKEHLDARNETRERRRKEINAEIKRGRS